MLTAAVHVQAQAPSPSVFASERFSDFPDTKTGAWRKTIEIDIPNTSKTGDQIFASPFLLRGVDFLFVGIPPITRAELQDAVALFIDRKVTIADLNKLRQKLSEALIAAGYVSSGVTIPDQEVIDGIVTMRIVTGRLSRLQINGEGVGVPGGGVLAADYLLERLQNADDEPFNLAAMEEKIRVLLDDRSISQIRATVLPGQSLGDTILDVDVITTRPYDLKLELSNGGFEASGREMAEATGAFRNLIGWGDEIRISAFRTKGSLGGRLAVDGPLPGLRPVPFLLVEATRSRVIEAPLDDLNIKSASFSIDFGVKTSVIKSSRRLFDVSAQFSLKRTKTTLLGTPFSFSPGVDNGRTKLRVFSLIGEWVERRPSATFAARATVNFGLDLFGATNVEPGVPDGTFISWLGQSQAIFAFDRKNSLRLGLQAQLASDPLLPSADISIGGRTTVRGFREAEIVTDQAVVASVEFTRSLGDFSLVGVTPPGHPATISASAFVDFGYAWDVGRKGNELVGMGFGLDWNLSPTARFVFELAKSLSQAPSKGPRSEKRSATAFFGTTITF